MVPVDLVNKLRVDTAEIAMASGGANVGYEIFDHSDALGSTNFVQNVNLIRALEGELGRTIRTVDNIKTRVSIWFCPSGKCSPVKSSRHQPRL